MVVLCYEKRKRSSQLALWVIGHAHKIQLAGLALINSRPNHVLLLRSASHR